MNPVIEDIYRTRVVDGRAGPRKLDASAIDRVEGAFLYHAIISRPQIAQTLEVGCAYGLSSLFICEALRSRPQSHHTIIDPGQAKWFDSAGVFNLQKAGLTNYTLLEEPSELVLPDLVRQGRSFDLVFIDGWHTFDHTLVDCFFATRLLRVGGLLIVDDCNWPSVSRVMAYLKNYPCYMQAGAVATSKRATWRRALADSAARVLPKKLVERVLSPALVRRVWSRTEERMICLEKTADDQRRWDWYREF
jgi:predicted O-methyltransferase YrrM